MLLQFLHGRENDVGKATDTLRRTGHFAWSDGGMCPLSMDIVHLNCVSDDRSSKNFVCNL